MANRGSSRRSPAEQISTQKLDLSSAGCDVDDDVDDAQTTDPGDSPRSTCSSHQVPCEDRDLIKPTRWADMEFSDCEFEESIKPTCWADMDFSDCDFEETIDAPLNSEPLQGTCSENERKNGSQLQGSADYKQTDTFEQRLSPPWKKVNRKGRKGDEKVSSKDVEKTDGEGVGKDCSEGDWWQQWSSNERSGKDESKGYGKYWQQWYSTGRSGKDESKGHGNYWQQWYSTERSGGKGDNERHGKWKVGSQGVENASSKGVEKASSQSEDWQQRFRNERVGKSVEKGGSRSEGWQQRSRNERVGKGGDKGNCKGASQAKFQCQFILAIEEDGKFRVVKRVLGVAGANMKRIAGESGAKLRLRGRGSKFLEGPEQKESDDDLMLCVSSQDEIGFEAAKRSVSELLEDIYHEYQTFCRRAGHSCPDLKLQINEGYRAGSR